MFAALSGGREAKADLEARLRLFAAETGVLDPEQADEAAACLFEALARQATIAVSPEASALYESFLSTLEGERAQAAFHAAFFATWLGSPGSRGGARTLFGSQLRGYEELPFLCTHADGRRSLRQRARGLSCNFPCSIRAAERIIAETRAALPPKRAAAPAYRAYPICKDVGG